ncbi:transcription initiation factor IIB family protein [Haloarcula sp. S1AR25-5A]|uniref:Transcription initiation factor IIB family protein n=1 Tax=Haloarcula terrestris TaxID=2950533 RepID=A0AAE4JJK1_9EURY|nr:transcription initiation factor IIB family protein [Haloarcula terrestris]MDS0223790.1 transcription initiation factor IIB family protein [Haloarcula terrestris]
MASSDIYERGFDESSGRTIAADTCPECGGSLDTDGGEIACRDCAVVIESCRLDRRGPRIFPEDDTSKARTGAPLTDTRHDRGLSTEIGHRTDANGNTLPAKKQRQFHRLRREHSRAQWRSKAERNLATGLSEIARITADLELTDSLQEQASSLFRTAQDNDLLIGRSVESIAAASVYATCRLNEATRTLNEVAAVASVDSDRVENGYRTLNAELELPVPPQSPVPYLPSITAEFDLPAEVEHKARELAARAHENGLSSGTHPVGFAAACLTVAAASLADPPTQLAIADAAEVSTATVRTHRDRLTAFLAENE